MMFFLEKVLIFVGFPRGWISLIMRCVSIISFSVLVNGSANEEFFSTYRP